MSITLVVCRAFETYGHGEQAVPSGARRELLD